MIWSQSVFKKNIALCLIFWLFFLFIAGCAGDKANQKKKVEALQQFGNALAAEGNLRGALAKLLDAVKLDPDNADLNQQIALVLRDMEEYKLSLKYFQRALSLDPKFSEARNNLGTLYLLMGKWDKAIVCFQQAVSDLLYQTPQFAYNNMGLAYFNNGDYDRAIDSYKRALKSSPKYTLAYVNLARAYEAKGNIDAAVASFKKAILYFPKDTAAHLGLAKALLRSGKKKEAKEELNLTIWADPTGPEAKEARERLKKLNIE